MSEFFVLVVVYFVGGQPVQISSGLVETEAKCAKGVAEVTADAKAKGAATWAECRKVAVPPDVKSPPPKPEAGSRS